MCCPQSLLQLEGAKGAFEVINKSLSKAGAGVRGRDYTVRAWSQHTLELALSWQGKQ